MAVLGCNGLRCVINIILSHLPKMQAPGFFLDPEHCTNIIVAERYIHLKTKCAIFDGFCVAISEKRGMEKTWMDALAVAIVSTFSCTLFPCFLNIDFS
jgi:hypothetical protein